MSHNQEDLAYGEDEGKERGPAGQDSDRGIIGDTFKYLKGRYKQSQQPYGQQQQTGQPYGGASQSSQQQIGPGGQPYNVGPQSGQQYGTDSQSYNQSQSQYGQGSYPGGTPQGTQPPYAGGPPPQTSQQKPDLASRLFDGLHGAITSIGSDLAGTLGGHYEAQQYGAQGGYAGQGGYGAQGTTTNLNNSFFTPKNGNDVKWHVDGCAYMWAVSLALEGARESIWILDWWLSPELYLRRPPAKNEQYRLDRMLQRAAQRGVRINIIVYKEVTQALSHAITSGFVRAGLYATALSIEKFEADYLLIEPPLTVSSSHTKHALEGLHPNIAVFRHPDHLPDAQSLESSLNTSFQNLALDPAKLANLGRDAIRSIYGESDDVILFWAHHEKLCLIDGKIAFMGGLDLCFGRWDTNQHPISDVHPTDLNATVFPGQDYNNARIMDFSDVANPDLNKLDRRQFSRIGWSDISVSLQGPCVEDLRRHFVDRWNFIFDEKYNVRKDVRYSRLSLARPAWGQQPVPLPPSQQNPPQTGSYGQPGQQSQTGAFPQPGQQSQLQPPSQQPPYGTPGGSNNSRPSSSYGTNPSQFPPPPGGQATQQPSWQGSTPQANVPAYQHLQQQNTYGLPVPEWQGTGQSQSPHPPQAQPSAQFSAPGPSQSGQHYPPPPPGPPPVSSPPPPQYGQQAASYGYVSPTYQPSPAAELEGSGPPQAYQPSPNNPPAGQTFSPPPAQGTRGIEDYPDNEAQDFESERAFGGKTSRYRDEGRKLGTELTGIASLVSGRLEHGVQNVQGKLIGGTDQYGRPLAQPRGVMRCQIVRSCTKWSNGTPIEHSIQNAYISVIQNSQHFVYIENQFFITATGDQQSPVKNLVGKALVDRILRAARAGEKYKVIVVIPSVPGFAGDLRDDSALGTRAIMEFQYNSINRGGHSIMQLIGQAGFNPLDYIRFYNLRNYDRINASATLAQVERQSGVNYEDARKQHDDAMGAPYGMNPNVGSNISPPPSQQYQANISGPPSGQPYQAATTNPPPGQQYQQYQQAAQGVAASKPGSGRWDSVSECYMLGGEDIRNVPWDQPGELSEIDAFVSEELYIHSKVLIADDRIVICGSANLNDRSQLGTHDSEIAILVEDPTPVQSTMGGRPWQASRFAASLRRQLFRKHLGLLRPQDMQRPDANFEPVGTVNKYDWGSPEDNIVSDPLSDTFLSLWNSRARQNTDIFRRVFRAVPDDNVKTWNEYKEFYEYYFYKADAEAEGKDAGSRGPKYLWGHIVRDDFQPGPAGIKEVKDQLSRVKGTLIEMPLTFLIDEDIAMQGLSLNAVTEELYT